MEAWRLYLPDGRVLEVEHSGGNWAALCGNARGAGASALDAMRAAAGGGPVSIAPGGSTLESWLAEHAAQLESEAG